MYVISYLSIWGLMLLPGILQGIHYSHFVCMLFASFDRRQSGFAAADILLTAGWPLCHYVTNVASNSFGMTNSCHR